MCTFYDNNTGKISTVLYPCLSKLLSGFECVDSSPFRSLVRRVVLFSYRQRTWTRCQFWECLYRTSFVWKDTSVWHRFSNLPFRTGVRRHWDDSPTEVLRVRDSRHESLSFPGRPTPLYLTESYPCPSSSLETCALPRTYFCPSTLLCVLGSHSRYTSTSDRDNRLTTPTFDVPGLEPPKNHDPIPQIWNRTIPSNVVWKITTQKRKIH